MDVSAPCAGAVWALLYATALAGRAQIAYHFRYIRKYNGLRFPNAGIAAQQFPITGKWLPGTGKITPDAPYDRGTSAQLGASVDAKAGSSGRTLYWSADNRELGRVERRTLTDRDIDDIVAFLESLSSESLKAEVRLSAR